MIAADIRARLVTAIGSDVDVRIYPSVAPQAVVTPLCVYNVTSRQIEHTLDGPTVYRNTHVLVDIYADTMLQASTVAEKVVASMAAWKTNVTVHVQDAGTDMVETTVQPNLYRVSMSFIITHNNA